MQGLLAGVHPLELWVAAFLRTHPQVIIGGILRENPYYVPPDEFLRELRERHTTRGAPPHAAV